jgi:hypothetical protein
LLLEDKDSVLDTRVKFPAAPLFPSIERGTLILDIYAVQDNTWETPFLNIKLGRGTPTNWDFSGTQVGVFFRVSGQTIYVLTSEGRVELDQEFSCNERHTVTIDFDTASGTFTAKLDGVPLTAKGGSQVRFGFYSPQSGVGQVLLQSGWGGNTASRVFFDNIQLVP